MARKDELLVPLMQGTANVSLKEKDIAKVEISLPTLDQQRRIVARIDTVATQIEEARTLQREVADELDALVISNHMRLSERRERRLSEILQLDEDAVQIDRKAEYPQVGIRSFGGGLFPKPPVAGNETTYRTFNRLFAGAVVLSQVKGWEGAIAICPESLAGWFASPEYRTFRCIDGEAVPSYLNRLVRTQWFWSKLAEATRGVGARRERTRPEQFLNVKMLMPTGQAQEIGAEVMAKIGEAERLRAKCAIELNALLPSVISRVFAEEL
jgi:type I restriction enzyme S subunit